MFDRYPPKSVVVGVDGSQAAIRAARWAVDEVAGTDIPLRLLYVAKADESPGPLEARAALVTAEEVVHDAYNAVAEMGMPLKVELPQKTSLAGDELARFESRVAQLTGLL